MTSTTFPEPPSSAGRSADIRDVVLDPVVMTEQQNRQIHGLMCVRCTRADGLSPAGFAYTASGGGGRLVFPVAICPERRLVRGAW